MTTFDEVFLKENYLEIFEIYKGFKLVNIEKEYIFENITEYKLYFNGYSDIKDLERFLHDYLSYPVIIEWKNEYFYCWIENIELEYVYYGNVVFLFDGWKRKYDSKTV